MIYLEIVKKGNILTNFSRLKMKLIHLFVHKLPEFLKLLPKFIVTINVLVQQVFLSILPF